MFKTTYLTDLHIGHNRVDSVQTHESLIKFFYPELETTDRLVIGGDFYHRLIDMNSQQTRTALAIIEDLAVLARKYGFIIRVIRGTFTHDRHQCRAFNSICRDVDIKVIERLELEVCPKTNLRILYMPDDLGYKSSEECMHHVRDMMTDAGWDSVDCVEGHGSFEHAVPPASKASIACLFNLEQFDFVKGWIVFGHIHSRSVRKNMFYPGSFERTNHGEEEAKGFLVIDHEDSDKPFKARFIDNENAVKFLTYDPLGSDMDKLTAQFNAWVEKRFDLDHPHLQYLRIRHEDIIIREALASIIRDKYTNIKVTCISPKVKETNAKELQTMVIKTKLTIPTEDNLHELVYDSINKVRSKDDVESMLSSLEEV
jgi:hypothetical protein